jgi:pimeloyl-ACP methyl ester carboxylesterase
MNPASPILNLHRTTSGAGPVLLMLHGVTRCGADWEPLLPALAAHWKVIALDQRGHGTSPRAESYLVTDYIADALRFVQEETAAPVVLFGHSLGAMVAAAVAVELPDQVRGIILEDPPFHTMGNRIAGSAWQAQFTGMREAARKRGTIETIADALADIRLPASGGGFKRLGEMRDRASLAWSAECLSQLDPEVLTPVINGRWLDGHDVAAVLSRVRCPVLLLQADPTAGGALTDADADAAESALPSCQRVRFPGIGHQLHRERPLEVLEVVQDFATSCQTQPARPL